MTATMLPRELRMLLDKAAIQDVLTDYARAVDRRDMALLRSTFHADATDDHGDCKGSAEQFIRWLDARHALTESSMHFLGNVHIEFFSDDVALVETYFASRRITKRPPAEHHQGGHTLFEEKLGRYVDRFERREGRWRVAQRVVVFDVRFTAPVQVEERRSPYTWTQRDASDVFAVMQAELRERFGKPGGG